MEQQTRSSGSFARSLSKPRPPVRTKKRSDALSATLASGALARVLIDFAVHPEDASHGRAIQQRTGLTPRSLQTELARLEALGVIYRRAEGRMVRYKLVEGTPRWRALRALVRELADPVDVVRNALADVPGIGAAFVFGSFARGDTREDSDVDVFVFGEEISDYDLFPRTMESSILLGREVNVVQMTRDELTGRIESGSSFIRNVLRGPKLWLVGSPDDLQVSVESTS